SVVPRRTWSIFFSLPLARRVNWSISNEGNLESHYGEWPTFFTIVSWFLWKSRNEFIFNQKNISSHDLLASARAWTRSFFIKGKSGKWTKKEIGGVIRGPNGELIGVFEMVVGLSDFFQIEAWALLEGIMFAWSQGYCKVQFEKMKFCTILRESNRVADCIAKEARGTIELLVIHNDQPNSIKHLLEDDILQVGRIPFDNY
ncbi:hypothetical protein Gotri_022685, partial [Gossypium trilobum]|nr:hypothetical protein [Gossypium trilobum]